MFSLSPAKILVILVVALVVLGPDKLPGVARQLGALWGDLRRLRTRLESEVRGVFPELPPTHELSQAVRSPLGYLNRLADEHEHSQGDGVSTVVADDPGPTRSPPGTSNGWGAPAASPQAPGPGTGPEAGEPLPSVPDDPSMN